MPPPRDDDIGANLSDVLLYHTYPVRRFVVGDVIQLNNGPVRVDSVDPASGYLAVSPITPSAIEEKTFNKYMTESNKIRHRINSLKGQRDKGHLMRKLQRDLEYNESKAYKEQVKELKKQLEWNKKELEGSRNYIRSLYSTYRELHGRFVASENQIADLERRLYLLWYSIYNYEEKLIPGKIEDVFEQVIEGVERLKNPPQRPPEQGRRIKIES